MKRYILKRLLHFLLVLFSIAALTFFLMHLVPGGPWDREKPLPPDAREVLERKYGLDRPLLAQFGEFLSEIARGDLGFSYVFEGRSVGEILREGLPATLTLGVGAFILSLIFGFFLGIAGALFRGPPDLLSLLLSAFLASTPNLILGILLILVFGIWLEALPICGWGTPYHSILPILALAAFPAGLTARVVRASLLEAMSENFVLAAFARGVSPGEVFLHHILRHALVPVLTVLGPEFAFLICGSFVIETLFSIPGAGRLFVEGVLLRDYGLIMGMTLFYAIVFSTLNFIVDLLCAALDPRIRYES